MRYRLMTAVGLLGLAAPAWADAWDFILTNSTGKDIAKVELSPLGANQWQADQLYEEVKNKTIKPSARSTIHFDKGASQCKWEIRATFADATSVTFPAVNLCDASFVTLRYGANGAPVAAGS